MKHELVVRHILEEVSNGLNVEKAFELLKDLTEEPTQVTPYIPPTVPNYPWGTTPWIQNPGDNPVIPLVTYEVTDPVPNKFVVTSTYNLKPHEQ